MQYPYFSTQSHPPSTYGWIYAALKGITQDPYLYLDKICDKSQEITMVSAEPRCNTHILALSLTHLVYMAGYMQHWKELLRTHTHI